MLKYQGFEARASKLPEVVPGEGIEPPAFGLQNRCTTAVLTRHIDTLSMT